MPSAKLQQRRSGSRLERSWLVILLSSRWNQKHHAVSREVSPSIMLSLYRTCIWISPETEGAKPAATRAIFWYVENICPMVLLAKTSAVISDLVVQAYIAEV